MMPVLSPHKRVAHMKICATLLSLILISLLIILAGLLIGTRSLKLQQLWPILTAPNGQIESILVWTLRLPRSLAAFTAGAGLAVSGYLLQMLTRNPLAGPGLTGATAGAVTPIVFCFVYLPAISSVYYPFIGMTGALTASVITLLIAGHGQNNPLHLALGGISISLFLNALTTYLILASGAQVPSLLFWLTGGLQGRSWPQLTPMLPWVFIAICVTFYCRRVLELLSLEPQIAASMGLDIKFWKPCLLILAILPVAGIVPVAGPVAFVGLAAPHIARLLSKNNQTQTLILCIFLGGSMVSLADIIARSIAAPQELPVSIITALIGGPVFIYLAQKRSISSTENSR